MGVSEFAEGVGEEAKSDCKLGSRVVSSEVGRVEGEGGEVIIGASCGWVTKGDVGDVGEGSVGAVEGEEVRMGEDVWGEIGGEEMIGIG